MSSASPTGERAKALGELTVNVPTAVMGASIDTQFAALTGGVVQGFRPA